MEKRKEKSDLKKQYELVEINGYTAPRYMREKVKHIMKLSEMFMENYFNKHGRFKY